MARNRKIEVQQNLVDRVIGYFDPVRAAQRLRARGMMAVAGSYIGGSKSRRATSGWTTHTGDADDDTLFDLPTLRDRSRDLIRNAPLAGGAVNTVCTNVVGSGLKLFPQIDRAWLGLTEDEATEWERTVRREFNTWAESKLCDVRRTQNFYDLQELAFRSTLESGDVFCLLPLFSRGPRWPYRLHLQVIEADRVSNPDNQVDTETMVAGVEKNGAGAPVAYHVSNFHPGNMLLRPNTRDWRRIAVFGGQTGRRNIIHLYKVLRPGQTRGVPYLAPVIEPLKQLVRYTEAELMAAVVSGMFTVFIKSEEGDDFNPMQPDDEVGGKTSDDDYKLANGAIVGLAPGESIDTANPGRPNEKFDPFVMSVLRQIGVGLELPFEILIKHFTASYSAARGAVLEAWKFFRARRQWLANNFCQDVYEAWMEDAILTGRITAPGFFDDPVTRRAYLKAMWIGPAKGQIDELKEINAAEKRLTNNLTTYTQETIELNGGDYEQNIETRGKERRLAIEHGLGTTPDATAPEEAENEPNPDQPEGPDNETT